MNINFTKGVVENTREREDETIDMLPEGRIKEFLILVELDLQKENISDDDKVLSPLSISRKCPRLFWTMVYKYNNAKGEKPKNMDEVLKHFWPERSWEHLKRLGRVRLDSAKARENKRQLNVYASEMEVKESFTPTVRQDDLGSSRYL